MKILKPTDLKDKDPATLRLLLLSQNFVFNKLVELVRKEKTQESKASKINKLSGALLLPDIFTSQYVLDKKIDIRDIEAQQSVYIVHDAEGGKKIIDKEGMYIKFDPNKTDRYYKKIIKQLRSSYAFMRAEESEKEEFIKSGGKSALHFLDNKKAKTSRNQHGYNLEEDLKIYLVCEKLIKEVFLTKVELEQEAYDAVGFPDKDQKRFLKDALDFAAERLRKKPERIKNIYYEVYRRYNLPSISDLARLIRVINS